MKDYISWILSALVIAILLYQYNKIQNLTDEAKIQNQNQKAILDSVRIIKNRHGEDIFLKNTLVADSKELKVLNRSLYEDLRRMEGKVKYISSIVSEIKNAEPITINNTVKELPDGTRELAWMYQNQFDSINSRTLEGNSRFSLDTAKGKIIVLDKGTTITRDEIKIKLSTGLTDLNESYQIFVKTDYPGVKFDKIDGAILDKKMFLKKKEKTFIFGPSINAGLGFNSTFRRIEPQISLGVSLTFNLNKYNKK